ncbi:MAG: tRNA (adenosine(37)-N6)-dimethylallyltransferase MiaA [Oligoflexia bacterium]|nr:tRNA (adenosine(37)-N6)-dimethylallyltransferase MiaA [Oligoflexia bacterium]
MTKLIFIVGATAVGKTNWALELARLIQSKKQTSVGILNSDSIQIYKDLNIGSAKPDLSSYPNINFYLFNELQAPQVGTAGFFRKKALEILHEKLPNETLLTVGGSGFYLQALEKGMYPVKAQSLKKEIAQPLSKNSGLNLDFHFHRNGEKHRKIKQDPYKNINLDSSDLNFSVKPVIPAKACPRESGGGNLQKESQNSNRISIKELYQELMQKDPEMAAKISPNDKYRILRALDLIKTEGKTVSQIKKEFKETELPWPYLKIGLQIPKAELLKRVRQRAKTMIQKGLIEETQHLIDKGFKNWKPLSSVGYKSARLYLEGKINKEDLESSIVSQTMRLAKKQNTWFKKDKNIQWFDWNLSPLKVYKQIFQ